MKTKKILLLLSLITLLANCSKGEQKTSAKINLKLSGIMNLTSGIGSGGAILFGKSSTGEQFGKIITGAEVNLDLLNGDWSFYTVMWEKKNASNFSDVAYCGKSTNKLSGSAVNINLNLSNATCADNDFSGGNHYSKDIAGAGLKNTFSSLFIEDCDDLAKSGNFTCNLNNQGNALSYRLNFRSYNKAGNGAAVFNNETIKSQCMNFTNAHASGLNVNFPTSNSVMPFVVSVEMYLGSLDCSSSNDPETKGMYTHIFEQGLEVQGPNTKMIFSGGSICTPKTSNIVNACSNYLGTLTPNGCSTPETISRFVATADCSNGPLATTTKSIKHIFSIPKSLFCFADISNYGLNGSDLFPAGNGSSIRPFKICNEWQINQIGEKGSSPLMSTYHYKLLNDLDMNKTDFGAFPKPLCTRENDSLVGEHHNFNPLDGLFNNSCDDENIAPSFTGVFNGNNKTISHARISAEGVQGVGFVRNFQSGSIFNLNFNNLEIQGGSELGGIAGAIHAVDVVNINNITIDGLKIESKSSIGEKIGSAAGIIVSNDKFVFINRFLVTGAELYGINRVGGLVGDNQAIISESKFSGALRVFGNPNDSYTGGLVGINNNGQILRSLSEGLIISNSSYVGGIIGLNSSGVIDSAYSTMYINTRSNPISTTGGIIGLNTNGGFKEIIFDGVIEDFERSFSQTNLISNGNTSSIPTTACFYTDQQSNYYPNPISSCNKVSRTVLISGIAFSPSGFWHNMVGSIPRFTWEAANDSRVCLLAGNTSDVLNQKNILKKGTSALNPIIICKPSQFSQLSSLAANDFVVLGENLNLSEFSYSDIVPTFAGNLDGKNYDIYGLYFNSVAPDSLGVALIKSNSGTISNLNLVGNKIFREISSDFTGILTAKNTGTIKNIKIVSNVLFGHTNVGLVTGENKGLIDKIKIRENQISGTSNVGGITGSNILNDKNVGAIIRRVSVEANIFSQSYVLDHVGGIAGTNLGIIDQAEFNGNINHFSNTAQSESYIGGIAGLNLGSISNVITSNHSQISASSTSFIGGLVGNNVGIINNSIALGRVLYNYLGTGASPLTSFSATVGQSLGGTNNLYFLEKNIGSIVNTFPVSSCMGNEAVVFSSNIFANPDLPDLYFNYTNSNNSLDTLSSVMSVNNNTMSYINGCFIGQPFTFVKSIISPGGMSVANFSIPTNFSALSMAYPGHMEENVIEYHKSLMYKRDPAMELPIWVLEEGDSYPRLLQVEI